MKSIILLLSLSLSLMAEVDLVPYKKAKHTVVKTLAKNSQVYKMSQDLAITKHKDALALWRVVAEKDAHFNMMLKQWQELKGNKDPQILKRFYLIDNELEYYILSTVKNDQTFESAYTKWADSQEKLNSFRLEKVKKVDREVLAEAYDVMAQFRNHSSPVEI
jgi:hypothetical protein